MASYEINLSLKELFILLFYKKLCPYCNSKLKRIKKTNFLIQGTIKIGDMNYYGDSYEVNVSYRCEKCNLNFKISEIAKKQGDCLM